MAANARSDKTRWTLRALPALMLLPLALQAHATPAPAFVSTCSSGTSNSITLTECSTSPHSGTYSIDNQSSSSIIAFAVSTEATDGTASSALSGWAGWYVSQSDWVSRYATTYGTYSDLFGQAQGVFMYAVAWVGKQGGGMEPMGSLIDPGTSTGAAFGFSAPVNSSFAAWGGDWSAHKVLAQATLAAPVPEPETYAMLLAGLGVVGTVARRRKTGR